MAHLFKVVEVIQNLEKMKLQNLKKQTGLAMLTTFMALVMVSCGDNKPKDTKEMAEDKNKEMQDTRTGEKDAQFLVDAAEINLEEIQLGQLAQSKGMTAEVKELGKMMETAHKKGMAEVKNLAMQKNIEIPTTLTENGMEAYQKLSEKTGTDFDKSYADMMVKGHKDAIDKFEKASKDATDGDIMRWATTMLPELNTHLEHAKETKDKLK
jgi:putative membrane protein